MELAPIVLFGYNRSEHITKTIESLKNNNLYDKSDLFVFVDGPKNAEDKVNQKKVCDIVNNITGFKTIQINISDKNKGLANSVIDGVTEIINRFGKAIVLEDDLELSKDFLKFMNEALEYYNNNYNIFSISGYSLPIEIPKDYTKTIYLSYRAMSWGWATWKDRWNSVDWNIEDYNQYCNNRMLIDKFKRAGDDLPKMLELQRKGKIDSWAVRWAYNQSMMNKYTVVPVETLVNNIGFDGSGTHCKTDIRYKNIPNENYSWNFTNELVINDDIANNIRKKYSPVSDTDELKIIKEKYNFMSEWVKCIFSGVKISSIIKNKYNVKSVAIYGAGIIGKNICKQLLSEGEIQISCFIDNENNGEIYDKKCLNFDEFFKVYGNEENIIITPFYYYDDIRKTIGKKSSHITTIRVDELIQEVEYE